MAEREEELMRLLMRVKGLKLNFQKMKIMAPGPTSSWQIERKKVEAVTGFIFLGSKITADSDYAKKLKDACSSEGKLRQL